MREASSRAHAFAFRKWYFDCLSDDGRTAVGYYVSLTWKKVSLTWQALNVWQHDQLVLDRSTLNRSRMPFRSNDQIVWDAPHLQCGFTVEARQQPVAIRLFGQPAGGVDWRCEAPVAVVTLHADGQQPLHGAGYVEFIELTVPPWELPISELRWGRWADRDARHSVVWIEWRGELPRSWLVIDGVHADGAEIHDDRVSSLSSTMTLKTSCTLSSRSLDDIVGRIPTLRTVVPPSILTLRAAKWLSHGTWQREGESILKGLALQERVVLR
jgi:hypothetical protein